MSVHPHKEPDVVTFDVEQGSEEWHRLRLGMPTASCFSDVMAQGGGKVRDAYLRVLAGERLTGVPHEGYKSGAMIRGNRMEPGLRREYAMMRDLDFKPVGFIRRRLASGFVGCSPDALVGDDGLVQIKSAEPKVLIEIMRRGTIPPEHLPQCQGEMLVDKRRRWVDLAIGYEAAPGYPGMPLFIRRIKRDEAHIARLEVGLDAFNRDLDELVRWIERYGKD